LPKAPFAIYCMQQNDTRQDEEFHAII